MGLVLASWLASASASEAHAAPPSLPTQRPLSEAISLDPGATCLDRQALLDDLGSWRDHPTIDERLRVEVRGDPDDPRALGFVVELDGRETAVRRFDEAPARCEDLHAVVALAIAIALDDSLASDLGIVEPAEPSAPADPLAPVEPSEPADPLAPVDQQAPGEGDLPRLEPRPRPPLDRPGPALALTPLALISAGLTPRLTGGAGLSFDIRPRDHFDVRLGGLVVHESGIPLSTGRVAMTLAAGRVDLCWGTAPLTVRLRLCAGVAGGATIASAAQLPDAHVEALPWIAGIGDVDVAVHLIGPLALEFRVEGVFPLMRNRFVVDDELNQVVDSVRPEVAGLLVGIGPRFEF